MDKEIEDKWMETHETDGEQRDRRRAGWQAGTQRDAGLVDRQSEGWQEHRRIEGK